MYFRYFLLILSASAAFGDNSNALHRFCVNEGDSRESICKVIQKGNSQVLCVPVTDSADCALKLLQGEADFGLFAVEDALVASKFIDNEVRIIGQLRNKDVINESYAFQTVVVVRGNFNGGISNLKNRKYCHPGFRSVQVWSDRVLKEFEKSVVPRRECYPEFSNAYQEMFSLAEFFKSACRPGQWGFDDSFDRRLKKKFPTLCELCDLPGKCLYNDEFEGSHIAALKCLENGGEVAYVALDYVKEYFGFVPSLKSNKEHQEYKFLCTNGNTQPLTNPCPWVKQPWPILVATKEKAPFLTQLVPEFICTSSECKGTWKEAFTRLLQGDDDIFLKNMRGDLTINNYLRDGRNTPKEWEGDACKRTVRLCTISQNEFEKCEWLKQAVITQDFEPRLSCVQSKSMWSCFDMINKREADIVGIDTDYSIIARNVYDLTAIMYQDNTYEGNYYIVALVKKTIQDVKSFADLKGKNACFPEYGGLAWNAFLSVAKRSGILPHSCPRVKAVSEFFAHMCAPGATDRDHKDYNISAPANLCSICAKNMGNSKDNCEAGFNNKYYGDFGALECLGNASVAFVNYRNLMSKDNEKWMRQINRDDYRILCRNGILINLVDYTQLDEQCVLASGVGGEIVTRRLNSPSETRDIEELLSKMDESFGEDIFHYNNAIRMLRPFNNEKGLLFKDNTVAFVPVHHDLVNSSINYFTDLLESVSETCHEEKKDNKKNNAVLTQSNLLVSTMCFFALIVLIGN